jgi:hypothetical protein
MPPWVAGGIDPYYGQIQAQLGKNTEKERHSRSIAQAGSTAGFRAMERNA